MQLGILRRTSIESEQSKQLEQPERPDNPLVETYTMRLSKRQKQFLGKLTFSSGKNSYVQLQHPPARTHVATDDSIQTQDCDRVISSSPPFQEINDEEVEPLISVAQDEDQFRLLFVYLDYDHKSRLSIL